MDGGVRSGIPAGSPRGGDRDLGGALAYGAGLAVTAVLAYIFTASMGRLLSADEFGTFGALMAGMLALSGPTTALFTGAAMTAARNGLLVQPPGRVWLMGVAVGAATLAFLPIRALPKPAVWFASAAAAWVLVSWYRGLLTGLGRFAIVGGSMVLDGVIRIAAAILLVSRGWGVTGASAGLAIGLAAAALVTTAFLPRGRSRDPRPIAPEVWLAVGGLLFLTFAQFADAVAIRLLQPHAAGEYNAASAIARVAMYAQAPAAAYALRRAAALGARRSIGRSVLLALIPAGLVTVVIEAFPRWMLDLTFGGRYSGSAGLLRLLTLAMLLAGAAVVLVSMLMGAGRVAWVWSVSVAALSGVTAVFLVGHRTVDVASVMILGQAATLGAAAFHAARLLRSERAGQGGVLFLNWRDTRHPQGGGSEVFVEQVARRLAATGMLVTVFCAEHPNAPREEVRDGVRFLRRGSWWTVYGWAAAYHLLGRFGPHDVVVDVQNGIPFFSVLYCGRPVVVLVHHVHREQWRMSFDRRLGRVGWWIESRLAPQSYRRATYVTVSESSRTELAALGVDRARISVVHNGTTPNASPSTARAARPTVAYLGRLVPHKRIELLLEATAVLRSGIPDVVVRVVGQGPWDHRLRETASRLGIQDAVRFEGFVSERDRSRILAEAWVLALPSVKEGWGLAVMEAAAAGTPAVAFRVGGIRDSILDGETGLLSDDPAGFMANLELLLSSSAVRERLGRAAQERAARFTWEEAATAMARILDAARLSRGPAFVPTSASGRDRGPSALDALSPLDPGLAVAGHGAGEP